MTEKRQFPIRHKNHSLEELSDRFFRQNLPGDWNVNPVAKDYGQDLVVEISEDGQFRGLHLVVQLKSSENPDASDNFEKQNFRVSTYNYLNNILNVVLIVKYIQSENEAYWILLKDIDPPKQDNESFTIRIPKDNRLSKIDWYPIIE